MRGPKHNPFLPGLAMDSLRRDQPQPLGLRGLVVTVCAQFRPFVVNSRTRDSTQALVVPGLL